MRLDRLIKKYEAKLAKMPPPLTKHDPHVSIITITDGPGGLQQTSNEILPEAFAHNVAKLMASWQAEDAKLEAEAKAKETGTDDKIKKQKIAQTEVGPTIQSENSQEESNSDDYIDVDDDEENFDSENESKNSKNAGFLFDIPKPNEKLPQGDSVFEINRAFLKTISEQKGVDPNGWQKLFEDFKDCMGSENNAFKAWTLCQ